MTTKQAFENYKRVVDEIESFDNHSDLLTELQYDYIIVKLINKQDESVIDLVEACGRSIYDSCIYRLNKCGNCIDHSMFKHKNKWRTIWSCKACK